jgi:hypothetical protein
VKTTRWLIFRCGTARFCACRGSHDSWQPRRSAASAGDGHEDYFRADRAWWYIVLLTIGYMVSRGLAKSGSRNAHDAYDGR